MTSELVGGKRVSKRGDKTGSLSKTEERNKQAGRENKRVEEKKPSALFCSKTTDQPVQDDRRDDERGVAELPRGMIAAYQQHVALRARRWVSCLIERNRMLRGMRV